MQQTQEYLKQAVNALNQAAQARKVEVDELRKSLTQRQQDADSRLNQIKQEEAQDLTQADITESDATRTARLRSARILRDEEATLKQQVDQLKRDTDQEIQAKQRNVDDIQKLAQQIDRDWVPM